MQSPHEICPSRNKCRIHECFMNFYLKWSDFSWYDQFKTLFRPEVKCNENNRPNTINFSHSFFKSKNLNVQLNLTFYPHPAWLVPTSDNQVREDHLNWMQPEYCRYIFNTSSGINSKQAQLWLHYRHEAPKRCYGCHYVNNHKYRSNRYTAYTQKW